MEYTTLADNIVPEADPYPEGDQSFESAVDNEITWSSYREGEKYFFRCVTYHYVARLKRITATDFFLEDASWIPDSGRFHDALRTGEFAEVEPYVSNVIINRNLVVDASIWNHDLPKDQK